MAFRSTVSAQERPDSKNYPRNNEKKRIPNRIATFARGSFRLRVEQPRRYEGYEQDVGRSFILPGELHQTRKWCCKNCEGQQHPASKHQPTLLRLCAHGIQREFLLQTSLWAFDSWHGRGICKASDHVGAAIVLLSLLLREASPFNQSTLAAGRAIPLFLLARSELQPCKETGLAVEATQIAPG